MTDQLAEHMAIPSLITGIIFLLLGWAFYQNPPSKINPLVGYRTKLSMKSQQHWDFSQRYSARQMMKGGGLMLVLSLLSYFIPVETGIKQTGGIILLVLCAIYVILTTETALRKRFPKSKE